MSVRGAKAPGVVLAGVAVVALVLGGLFVTDRLEGASGTAVVKPALVGQAPRWHDGYNHFIVTVTAPLSVLAGKMLAQSRHDVGDRRAVLVHSAVGARPNPKSAQLTVALRSSSRPSHLGGAAASGVARSGPPPPAAGVPGAAPGSGPLAVGYPKLG